MTPTVSRSNLSLLWPTVAIATSVIGATALAVNAWRTGTVADGSVDQTAGTSGITRDANLANAADGVFVNLGLGMPQANSSGNADIRLVGTFFEYAEIGTNSLRHAVLADIQGGNQAIVMEGGNFSGHAVTKIERDSVTVQRNSDRSLHVLRLANPGQNGGENGPASGTQKGAGTAIASAMNFGGQIATNHWVLNRQGLLGYYQELRDNPDRLLKVFDTMKPLRDEAGKITGYTVGIEGEKGFFDSVGLREGDAVRGVNGRPLTNRRMAERLIADFVKDRANAFVLEVERNGKTEKLTYQIR